MMQAPRAELETQIQRQLLAFKADIEAELTEREAKRAERDTRQFRIRLAIAASSGVLSFAALMLTIYLSK